MSKLSDLRYEFWHKFYEYTQTDSNAKKFTEKFGINPPQPSIANSTASYYPLNTGSGKYALYCEMKISPCVAADLRLDIKNDPVLLERLTQHRDELEKVIGHADKWCKCTGKTYTIIFSTQCDLANRNAWERQFEWYCQNALVIREFLEKYREK